MRTFISIENHKAEQFEQALEKFNFLNDIESIRERDFMTDFIFEDLNDEEEETLEAIKSEMTFHF